MGSIPNSGSTLGRTGGATLGSNDVDAMGKEALRDKMNAAKQTDPPKPSAVTGDPYDDHPGMLYSCEGPFKPNDSAKVGASSAAVAGSYTALRSGVAGPEAALAGFGAGAGGYYIGHTRWYTCFVNEGYNAVFHPDANQVPREEDRTWADGPVESE